MTSGMPLTRNNINIGSLLVKDGKYLYNLEFSSYLRTVDDVAAYLSKAGDRLIQLKDVAEVGIQAGKIDGNVLLMVIRGL